ncbi:hypothetical protein BGW41_003315 [Actinomortierella wolfii]|nr:hypothetical protein BGW41_003315 [Actinomortierella wolfii]
MAISRSLLNQLSPSDNSLDNHVLSYRRTSTQSPLAARSAAKTAHNSELGIPESDDDVPPIPYVARARSSTFRYIFDDMIAHNAWGTASATASCGSTKSTGDAEPERAIFDSDSGIQHTQNEPLALTHLEIRSDPLTTATAPALLSLADNSDSANSNARMFPIQHHQVYPPYTRTLLRKNGDLSTLADGVAGQHRVEQQGIEASVNEEGQGTDGSQSALSSDVPSFFQSQQQLAGISLEPPEKATHSLASCPAMSHSNTSEAPLLPQLLGSLERSPVNNSEEEMESNSDDERESLSSGIYDDEELMESDDSDQDDNVNNGFLPELSLDLADPEGSRFDELLYWVIVSKFFPRNLQMCAQI